VKIIDGVEYLSTTEAAKMIGISKPTLYKAINRGGLPVYNTTEGGTTRGTRRRYLLEKSVVLDYIRRSRVAMEIRTNIHLKLTELKLVADIAKTKFEISGDIHDKMDMLQAELNLVRFQMDMGVTESSAGGVSNGQIQKAQID